MATSASDLILKIQQQLASLRSEIEHVERTMQGLIDQRNALDAQERSLETTRATIQALMGDDSALSDRDLHDEVKTTIASAAAELLKEYGGEAEMKTLVAVLTERGILRGRERRATLSTQLLRRKDLFHRVSPGRWALGPLPPPPIPSPADIAWATATAMPWRDGIVYGLPHSSHSTALGGLILSGNSTEETSGYIEDE